MSTPSSRRVCWSAIGMEHSGVRVTRAANNEGLGRCATCESYQSCRQPGTRRESESEGELRDTCDFVVHNEHRPHTSTGTAPLQKP